MSELSELILPVGLVFLGAYVVKTGMAGYQTPVCTGPVSQSCLGPICWTTCTSPAVGPGGMTVGPTTGPGGSVNTDPNVAPRDACPADPIQGFLAGHLVYHGGLYFRWEC